MHRFHKLLFDYAEILKKTDVGTIEITDDKVIMTIRDNNIRIICDKNDERIFPIEMLNFDSYENEQILRENDVSRRDLPLLALIGRSR